MQKPGTDTAGLLRLAEMKREFMYDQSHGENAGCEYRDRK